MAVLAKHPQGTRSILLSPHMVGRSRLADLRMTEPTVSGEHAVLRWTGGDWELHDLGSRNGTIVDGRRLAAGMTLTVEPGVYLRPSANVPARFHDIGKTGVDSNFENVFPQRLLQSVRHMKILQRQNSAWLRRKPFDCTVLHRHGKNTEPVSFQQKFRLNHSAQWFNNLSFLANQTPYTNLAR
jgi:hypothetical protein